MERKDSDTFEINNLSKITTNKSNNFFMQESDFKNISFLQGATSRHLNDYDSTLLEEDAYKKVDNELFQLEYKIEKTEKEIKNINEKIRMATNIGDISEVSELQRIKENLTKDYENYIALYKDKSISTKLSMGLTNSFHKKHSKNIFKVFSQTLSDALKTILPDKINQLIDMKESIDTLEHINKNVKDLVSKNYGTEENNEKYTQLSKYIIKSNELQNKISKNITK